MRGNVADLLLAAEWLDGSMCENVGLGQVVADLHLAAE
jgi:hypothetical protein